MLFHGGVALPPGTEVRVFHPSDRAPAEGAVAAVGAGWQVTVHAIPAAEAEHGRFLAGHTYRGSGLDFDRLKDDVTLMD